MPLLTVPEGLIAGATLPLHTASARMPTEASENKIHEHGVARDLGFRGALVPGITVYAWMTHPVVAALGPAWLERGTFSVRLLSPVYFDEPVTAQTQVVQRGDDHVQLEVTVVDGEGRRCAVGRMSLSSDAAPPADVAAYPAAPLPQDRPTVSRDLLASLEALGTPDLLVDEPTAHAFAERVSASLPLYRGPHALAHPGLLLEQANRALSRNVRVSPWIHVESDGRHLSALRVGERLETRGRVKSLFDKKGHQFVELDLLQLANGARPVASIRHVAIYRLKPLD